MQTVLVEASLMTRPDRIDDLDDVKTWIADHDGRIDAFWDAQHSWNDKQEVLYRDSQLRTEGRLEEVQRRMSAIERKVMLLAGAGSVAGALVGSLVPLLFKSG